VILINSTRSGEEPRTIISTEIHHICPDSKLLFLLIFAVSKFFLIMTLEEKGKFAPPSIMTTYPQKVSDAIQQCENLIAATHWDLYDNNKVDGADLYVGKN